MPRPRKHQPRSPELKEWGEKLVLIRESLNLTPKAAAKRTGIPMSTLTAYERGIQEIGLVRLLQVAAGYDGTLSMLTDDRWLRARDAVRALRMPRKVQQIVLAIIEDDRRERSPTREDLGAAS